MTRLLTLTALLCLLGAVPASAATKVACTTMGVDAQARDGKGTIKAHAVCRGATSMRIQVTAGKHRTRWMVPVRDGRDWKVRTSNPDVVSHIDEGVRVTASACNSHECVRFRTTCRDRTCSKIKRFVVPGPTVCRSNPPGCRPQPAHPAD